MAEDYYKTLGVNRNANQQEIQKAYFDMARKYHPDLHPDDKNAKRKFQEVQRAFEVLSDPKKREMYDRYGASFEEAAAAGAGPGGAHRAYRQRTAPGGGAEFEDFDFSQFFGERFGAEQAAGGMGGFADFFSQFRRGAAPEAAPGARPSATTTEISIPFQLAVTGGEVQLALTRAGGKQETVTVRVPAGIEAGKKIRLRGQGEPKGQADLLVKVNVEPHPFFQRRGDNLEVRVPVTLGEAAAGAKVDVPTPHGTIAVRVPPGTSSGTRLRLKGQGVRPKNRPAGDLYVEVLIALPKTMDDESRELLRQFDERNRYYPRSELRW